MSAPQSSGTVRWLQSEARPYQETAGGVMSRAGGGRRSVMLSSSVVASVQKALARLSDIWETLGIGEERRLERLEVVRVHTEELLERMVAEEEEMQAEVEQGIAGHLEEVRALSRELGEPEETAPSAGQRLLQQEKELRLRLGELRGQRDERLRELRRLQHRDQKLCAQLCQTPHYLPSGVAPSQAELLALEEQVRAREQERGRRAHTCRGLREHIHRLRRETGEDPDSSGLEQQEDDEEEADLTPEVLQALRDRLQQLQRRREELLEERELLRRQVIVLCKQLRVGERSESLAAGPGGLCGELRLWEAELARLQALRREQLEGVTLEARRELQLYWDKCRYSEEQRASFSPLRSTAYSEELLLRHDQEVVRVKMHYERSRALLEAAERWKGSWARFLELERRACDPNRFNNRGGSLLKVEKERAQVQKLLARVEEELRRDAQAWEDENGQHFLVEGQRLLDYVAEQWEQHRQDKEREKQQRTIGKGETPLKRAAGASTQCPANKARKIASAPAKHNYALCLQ